MKRAKQINELNQKELSLGYTNTPSSWHNQEKNRTAYIYIGGLDFRLTEGDLLSVFSQYGEIVDIDLVREEQELTSKGFCFIAYEDIRSTILAIDNLNGIELGGRIICVDHAPNYYKKVVEDPEEDQNSKNGRGSSSSSGRYNNNRYQQEKKENIPKYETMEKDGMIYKKIKKGNDFEWTLYHDAMKKKDPNWLHKYLMMTMFEESKGRHDSSEEEEDEEVKSSNVAENEKKEEPKKKLSKEEKKRKKEEKKERKELKKLKKMEEKMFGGLDADL